MGVSRATFDFDLIDFQNYEFDEKELDCFPECPFASTMDLTEISEFWQNLGTKVLFLALWALPLCSLCPAVFRLHGPRHDSRPRLPESATTHDSEFSRLHDSRLLGVHDHDWTCSRHDSRPRLVFDLNNLPRPKHWSGWCLNPSSFEFWLGDKYRIHERLKYNKVSNNWKKEILYP